MLVNLWYSGGIVNKSTGSFIILAALQVRLVGWSVRWKVVDPTIHTTWIHDYTLIIAICRLEVVVILRLGVEMLGRGSLRVEITRKVLERLFFFHKSNQKVVNLVAQSIIRLY